jgi:hypothetical protein
MTYVDTADQTEDWVLTKRLWYQLAIDDPDSKPGLRYTNSPLAIFLGSTLQLPTNVMVNWLA